MSGSQSTLPNGNRVNGVIVQPKLSPEMRDQLARLNGILRENKHDIKNIHSDPWLLAVHRRTETGFIAVLKDLGLIIMTKDTWKIIGRTFLLKFPSLKDFAPLIAAVGEYGPIRALFLRGSWFLRGQVEAKWSAMLHPPLSYLGDAFQYRTVDGSFNSVLHPHLGQAGAPYAKTVQATIPLLGAQPDPGDIFDRLLARAKDEPRVSKSGLSVLLIYHATIIIHDIFRTNSKDKNISDTSSYLDLSPLYGYNEETLNQVRRGHLGLLWPDTFAEDRLLRQPPGVCTMLVMYNRYHNYCARQLLRINENGRFQVPDQYAGRNKKDTRRRYQEYEVEMKNFSDRYRQDNKDKINDPDFKAKLSKAREDRLKVYKTSELNTFEESVKSDPTAYEHFLAWKANYVKDGNNDVNIRYYEPVLKKFTAEADAAWKKLDDDLFNTARLITCGLYINISIHDYLRALMGFHQWNTTFTLDPRVEVDKKNGKEGLPRGIGNQVSVEFNVLYRFHCAISTNDEKWLNRFIQDSFGEALIFLGEAKDRDGNYITKREELYKWDPTTLTSDQFNRASSVLGEWKMKELKDEIIKNEKAKEEKRNERKINKGNTEDDDQDIDDAEFEARLKEEFPDPREPRLNVFFGLQNERLERDKNTNRFDDQALIDILTKKMDDPICQFGPQNVPRALRAIEIAGILQARKWEVGTLNDFREFFGMERHKTFEDISRNKDIQQALSDLYEDVDKVEFYPGVFCEGREEEEHSLDCDPGPQNPSSTLWSAIFSDAVTLVRSDRFYTVDWNTNSLTSWGMKEVTADGDVLKSSVFHRLLQRSFPDWYGGTNLHFFHPFYTTETNMKYAKEQGYGPAFNLPEFDPSKDDSVKTALVEVTENATPTKPNQVYTLKPALTREKKPDRVTIIVKDYKSAKSILQYQSEEFVNPAWLDEYATPAIIRKAIRLAIKVKPSKKKQDTGRPTLETGIFHREQDNICRWFRDRTLAIVAREKMVFEKPTDDKDGIFQIDAVRDLAIPVITQYFAEFLGFGHLLFNEKGGSKKGKYSENEMYFHITNVQLYLSYNTDETKKWKRREDFKNSISLLLKLTREGNIRKATSWFPLWGQNSSRPEAYMTNLGYEIARQLIERTELGDDLDVAAATLLLLAIDSAYNAVLIFTTTLAFLFDETNKTNAFKYLTEDEQKIQNELYAKVHREHQDRKKEAEAAEIEAMKNGEVFVMNNEDKAHLSSLNEAEKAQLKPRKGLRTWQDVQDIALGGDEESVQDHKLMHIVLEAQRLKVKLPLVRRVKAKDIYSPVKIPNSKFEFRDGDTVIIDVHSAESEYRNYCNDEICVEDLETECADLIDCFQPVERHVHGAEGRPIHRTLSNYLAFAGSFSQNALTLDARYIVIVGLGSMFKVMGQMKFLRQGHDSQGRLKIINNSPSWHDLDYFMAPKTVREKLSAIRAAEEERNKKNKDVKGFIPESFETKPPSSTYLTPEWDETLPFPNTFKVRFDGYGEGVWVFGDNSDQSHGIMTLYAPQGPSHIGGSWAQTKCPCSDGKCPCHKNAAAMTAPYAGKGKASQPTLYISDVVASGCGAMGTAPVPT